MTRMRLRARSATTLSVPTSKPAASLPSSWRSRAIAVALSPRAMAPSAASSVARDPTARGHLAKLDDLAADRERRHQSRALQRLSLIRHCGDPAIHAALPILQPRRPARRLRARRRSRRVSASSRRVRCSGDNGGIRLNASGAMPHPIAIASAVL